MPIYKYDRTHFPCVGHQLAPDSEIWVDVSCMGFARWFQITGREKVIGPFYGIAAIEKALVAMIIINDDHCQ
jgi:hypothetical protein